MNFGSETQRQRLNEVPYKSPPWSIRYPKLVTILDDDPDVPLGNIIDRNIHAGSTEFDYFRPQEVRDYVKHTNTFETDPSPSYYADVANLNFTLVPNHPAYAAIGF